MRNWNPHFFILAGFFLVVVGFILPFLMVLQVIQSTFLLNFLAYGSSFSGLLLGIIGSAFYNASRRKRRP